MQKEYPKNQKWLPRSEKKITLEYRQKEYPKNQKKLPRSEKKAERRSKETDAQRNIRKEKDAKAKEKSRKMPKNQYIARNALKVLYGEQIVPELKHSDDKIGPMDCRCQD